MRIDEPQDAVLDPVSVPPAEPFEPFHGHLGPPDAHQVPDRLRVFFENFQPALIQPPGQEVEEGEGAGFAPADLLVSAEGHLPGGEPPEHEAAGLEKAFQPFEEQILSLRLDVLDDVVDEDQVEGAAAEIRALVEEIPDVEGAPDPSLLKIRAGVADFVGGQVNAGDVKARFGERQKVSAFSAADFEDRRVRPRFPEPGDVRPVAGAGGFGERLEIAFPVGEHGYLCRI